nr:MAG TPA: STRUCTURAL MAINTENANCE OF CHROMOSOMES PROTEIN [Caudoviricetes sp.]
MWKLKRIYAKNLLSFKEFEYSPTQGVTTLIFGNNMDADNQSSNGSGKSALLEATSIVLTGETLRKVKAEEIINDMSDSSLIGAELFNDVIGESFCIERTLSRKEPQKVICLTNGEETDRDKQSSVAEYNRYILDRIGLTKDDIFGNFILSKHKYDCFLSSSDREKKEIINRFSNANIIDSSVEELQKDISPVESKLRDAELKVSHIEGKIAGVEDQIERAIENEQNKASSKESRKAELNESIANRRKQIREFEQNIEQTNENLKTLDNIYNKLSKLEESDSKTDNAYKQICGWFTSSNLSGFSNWAEKAVELEKQIGKVEQEFEAVSMQISKTAKSIKAETAELEAMRLSYRKLGETNEEEATKLYKALAEIKANLAKTKEQNEELEERKSNTSRAIANLKNSIAGEITCPACKHRFVLDADIDVKEVEADIKEKESILENINESLANSLTTTKDLQKQILDNENQSHQLSDNLRKESRKLSEKSSIVDQLAFDQKRLVRKKDDLDAEIDRIERSISSLVSSMFDEAFDILDKQTKIQEAAIEDFALKIRTCQGAIETFQNSIDDLDKVEAETIVDSLKATLKEYEKEYVQVGRDKADIEKELFELKEQEQLFVEFKTHLANSKIDALANMTNTFLENIGSDIRIQFSGYTVLKSGKVRDKISISLFRNGIDCGSFDKFSEGEKARVNMANILAMQKLTNLNCEEGKGLDLLVLDEILEATDETGLASIFDSLNSLQLTSLVVSHGNVAENYPHKLIINKKNDVSFI